MTILVGFSASRQSDASINLAKQIAESAGEPAVAASIIERPWPPRDDPVEKEYLQYRTEQVRNSLNQVARKLPGETVPAVVHESSSVPTGLMELAAELKASLVVVGSSSSGLLGRVALGSVTGRLVHSAAVPVAIAPRGYPVQPTGLRRISASYGGEADINGLIGAAAELAKKWSVPLRIVSFTVRPSSPFGGQPNTAAEDLVVQQWARRTHDEISRQLDSARTLVAAPDVEVVVGSGPDWHNAVESVGWEAGDILALGSGAAGPAAQVFLGSAASKILRYSPVPVVIVPRHEG
jgi:nucleotide-binding universal stress UspA family protein